MISISLAGRLPARPGSRAALRPPPPPDRRWPAAGLAVSVAAHLLLAAAGLALLWRVGAPPRTYVVNLVPAVAAVGIPTAPRTKSQPVPSETPQPSRPAETPRATAPPTPLPPRPLPARETARLPEPSLPSRSLPARTATLRPGEKETPPLATPSSAARANPRAESPAASEPPRPSAPQAVQGLRTGSPAGVGALTLDASDFPHAWYLRQVHQKIEDEWRRRPPGNEPGHRPVILVEIMRDGSIRSPRVEQSSGSAFYDQAALRAVVGASPFPPLPRDWSRPSLRVMLGFTGMDGG